MAHNLVVGDKHQVHLDTVLDIDSVGMDVDHKTVLVLLALLRPQAVCKIVELPQKHHHHLAMVN